VNEIFADKTMEAIKKMNEERFSHAGAESRPPPPIVINFAV